MSLITSYRAIIWAMKKSAIRPRRCNKQHFRSLLTCASAIILSLDRSIDNARQHAASIVPEIARTFVRRPVWKLSAIHLARLSLRLRIEACAPSVVLLCLLGLLAGRSLAADAPISAADEAAALQARGDLNGAAAVWQNVLRTNPADVQALVSLGILFSQMKRYQQAETYYEKALKYAPSQPEILLNLALAHFKSADLNGAIPLLRKVLALKPDNRQAELLLGISYYGTSDFQKAVPILEKMPEAQTSDELRQMLAQAYIWTGQTDKATNVLASLLRDSPESAVAHIFLGQAYDGENKTDDAIR